MSFNKKPNAQIPSGIGKYLVFALFFLFLFIALTNTTFLTIDAGEKGVLFKKFSGGLDKENVYPQGFHVVAPWNTMFIYDIRTNEAFEEMEVLSKNGLNITIELSYRYSPEPNKIGFLHDEIGKDYVNRIIKPEIRSATREVIGQYLPEELYSTKREAIQQEIFDKSFASIARKNLILDAILIRSVTLPDNLRTAIEKKLEEEQLSLQYQYKIDRERQEAERRVIEAQAKADANRILNASLTDKILRDKGIEATLMLAKSPNSKVVVVGGSGDGLPLILNN
ncbi:MAG: prohibitin family protein [Saprospiraceae bacterium]|nr:prohibitin family protein [Saprospiraceae bacterium]